MITVEETVTGSPGGAATATRQPGEAETTTGNAGVVSASARPTGGDGGCECPRMQRPKG